MLNKPKRQPDYIHRDDPYWFEEMLCIVYVQYPMSEGRHTLELGTHDHGNKFELYIKYPRDSNQGGYVGAHYIIQDAYNVWIKQKAEELLLGVDT